MAGKPKIYPADVVERFTQELAATRNITAASKRLGHSKQFGRGIIAKHPHLASLVAAKGELSRTHGRGGTPEYILWAGMKDRCQNAHGRHFPGWGGRGIKVCERWHKFENFFADMGPRPSTKHSLDRIDNDGNYEPGNCRWATWTEQASNRRNNDMVQFRGETRTLNEWSRVLGIGQGTLWHRLYTSKWSVDEALGTPTRKHPKKAA